MIQIEDLNIDLGEFHLRDVSLAIEDGEYMVLLGPTGAGKTVVVECLVGIYRPRTGRMLIGGEDVTGLYPEERGVGYVPQDYALFPNMTVRQNLAYGLKARKRPAGEIDGSVDAMMELLDIAHLHYRMPLNLSGGEKQRVALGRALITEPRILLLDEPLAALDENLRSELAAELRRVQRALGGTFLHVCHSFEETSEVADRIAIMNEGRIVQVGSMDDVLARPADLFVARFTLTRNFIEGVAEAVGDGCRITSADGHVLASSQGRFEGKVTAAIRPEHIEVLAADSPDGGLKAQVADVRLRPTYAEIQLDAGVALIAHDRLHGGQNHAPGQAVSLRIPPDAVKVFPS